MIIVIAGENFSPASRPRRVCFGAAPIHSHFQSFRKTTMEPRSPALRAPRPVLWATCAIVGVAIAMYVRSQTASGANALAKEPAPASVTSPPTDRSASLPPQSDETVAWSYDFGPRLEIDAHWAFYESSSATGASAPEKVLTSEGTLVTRFGSPQVEHDHEGIFVDPARLMALVTSATASDEKSPMPASEMQISFSSDGWLEYRDVLGSSPDKLTRGVVLHDKAGNRTLLMYALTWDKKSAVPEFNDRLVGGGFLSVSERSPHVATLVFEARPASDGSPRRVVGNLDNDGRLVLWTVDA